MVLGKLFAQVWWLHWGCPPLPRVSWPAPDPCPWKGRSGGTVLGELQQELFACPGKGAGPRARPCSGLRMPAPSVQSLPRWAWLRLARCPGPSLWSRNLPRTPARIRILPLPQANLNLGPLWPWGWWGPDGPGKVPSLMPLPGWHPGWGVVGKTPPLTPSTVPLEFPSAWGATSWPLLKPQALN